MVVLTPFIPYIAGAIGFGSNLLNRQAANAERDARNAQIRARNRAQLQAHSFSLQKAVRERQFAIDVWNQRAKQAGQNIAFNNEELGRAIQQEQVRLNDVFAKAAYQNVDLVTQLAKASGAYAAAGRTGRSAQRAENMMLANLGRAQTRIKGNLQRAERNSNFQMDNMQRRTLRMNQAAANSVAILPQFAPLPMAPIQQQQFDYSASNNIGIFNDLLGGIRTGLSFA